MQHQTDQRKYICIWLVLRWLMIIIDVCIVSYNRHSSILSNHVIIIACIHIRIHGCIQLCIHIYCIQVHCCHSIIVNHQISLKLKREKNRLNFNRNNRWMRESAVSKETALLHRWGEWNWPGGLIIINHSAFIRVYILQSSVKKGRSLLTLCGQTNVFGSVLLKSR